MRASPSSTLRAAVAMLCLLLLQAPQGSTEPAPSSAPAAPGATFTPRPLTEAEIRANKSYATGQRLFLAGKFSEAVSQLEITTRNNARFLPAWYMLGIAYQQVGAYAQAEKAFVETTRLDARHFMGYVQAAGAALAQGHYEAARRYAQEIHRYDQRSFLGHYALGVCAYTEGHLHEAVSHFERCRMAYEEFAPGLYNLAVALYNEHGAQRALGRLRQACLAEPKKGLYHFAQGWYFFMIRDTMSGYNAFRRLLECDQGPLASTARGLMALQSRSYAEALKETDAALSKDPELVKAWVLKGMICAAQGNGGGARGCYLEALALDSCDLDARKGLTDLGIALPPMRPARLPRTKGDAKEALATPSSSPSPPSSPPSATPTATGSPAPSTAEQIKARHRSLPPALPSLPPGIPQPRTR